MLLTCRREAKDSVAIDPTFRGQPVDSGDASVCLVVDISRVLVSGVRVGALFQFLGDVQWREDDSVLVGSFVSALGFDLQNTIASAPLSCPSLVLLCDVVCRL